MGAISIQQMADRVADLMESRLGAGGTGLDAKLRSRGSALPRKVRQAADQLAKSAAMAQNPKLLMQIDHESLAQNYDITVRYLSALRARSSWLQGGVAIMASIAMSVFLVVLLVIALLRWRGLV